GLVGKYALGQFQLEQRGRQTVFVQGASHQLGEFRVFQLLRGYIQSEARRGDVLVAPARELRAGRIESPTPDVDDQPALLRGGDELTWLPHAIRWRLPSQQRLHARESSAADNELWLVEQGEFAAPQRALQAGFRGNHGLGVHLRVEEHG